MFRRRWPKPHAVVALLLLGATAWPALAMPADRLTCRSMGGPWQPCTMQLDANGLGWQLRIGTQPAIRFRHDGLGNVSIRSGANRWQPVEARWLADASLCWDGICARGPIPLD